MSASLADTLLASPDDFLAKYSVAVIQTSERPVMLIDI